MTRKNKSNLHFEFKPVDNEQMDKLFKRMKGKTSSGLDSICGLSLKLAFPILYEELKFILNLSLQKGKYSKEWKKAKIVPVLKNKGSRFECSNYRPVANLSEFSKLQEMVVFDQLYHYFESNDLFHPEHHGFKKNRSTVTALQQLRDFWLKNIDDGKLCSALLLDLSAGFDVINLNLLQSKLRIYGFDELTLSWFKDYLEERSQCVQIDTKTSSLIKVPFGVPQGGQLSPLLFTIFIMELPEVVKESINVEDENEPLNENEVNEIVEDNKNDEDVMTVVYADDNTPTCEATTLAELEDKTQRMADKTVEWFINHEMIVSSEKTKLLMLGSSRNRKLKIAADYEPNIKVDNENISLSKSEKLLGLIINDTLS